MRIEVNVPPLPESVADATLGTWHKRPGEPVRRDENLVDLETDKVVLELPAPESGVLAEVKAEGGAVVTPGTVVAVIDTEGAAAVAARPRPAAEKPAAPHSALSPAVRKLVAEHGLEVSALTGTGKDGRITKGDVLRAVAQRTAKAETAAKPQVAPPAPTAASPGRREQRVPMTRLRARIAERLVQAQHNAAMLTTFNEANMQPVLDLRQRYQESFQKKYGIKLGFMSFFIKAAVAALKEFPAVNAAIDGTDIVYHNYFDVGVAVSTERGLVVPIVRDADALSFAGLEKTVLDYAQRAREAKLDMAELSGGTFTITNGGVFGSLLSTPILNPPQSAILGMHKIDQRPVAENGQVVIRPMMYLALSYDHRLIDGREAVSFLVTIKQMIEDPARLLLQV
ncbi:MAG TPA: 2-oxoglutarate dehydrogenase complex dihydrolipoyllysine-residue succinyltransferase [Gammaproteobacteria bacterium]|nr:2-oxoglutarate dehydrogenase complex dihydrolipoyllysine-residue succinyltransferase [Gammaproteobacteria bacterium]